MAEPGSLIRRLLSEVPDYKEFMTVAELYESSRRLALEHRDVTELVEVGPSRAEEPVTALIIRGGDEKRILAFAFPHPNEPIGSLTLEFLSRKLVEDRGFLRRTKATWIFVKVADVYGAKLNEGWFKGGFDLRKYALNYYRPPPYKQVEWTFPFEYKTLRWDKPIPETRALMKLIDEWRPTHIYSLHNAGFTGTYYYVTERPPEPALRLMRELPRELGVPLHRGEPEAPYMERIDEAVFRMPSTAETYDWLEKHLGRDPAEIMRHGGSSYDYARHVYPEVFELVCEVPYIYDDRLDITIEIGIPRREILRIANQRAFELLEKFEKLDREYGRLMSPENPFYEAFAEFLRYGRSYLEAERRWIERAPELERSATVAQAFDAYKDVHWSALFRYGLLHRAAKYELERGADGKLRELAEIALEGVERELAMVNKLIKYRVIPISNLVKIQLGAILATALL